MVTNSTDSGTKQKSLQSVLLMNRFLKFKNKKTLEATCINKNYGLAIKLQKRIKLYLLSVKQMFYFGAWKFILRKFTNTKFVF